MNIVVSPNIFDEELSKSCLKRLKCFKDNDLTRYLYITGIAQGLKIWVGKY